MNAIGYMIRVMAVIIVVLFVLTVCFPGYDPLISGLIVLVFCSIIFLLCIDTIDRILIKISENICGNGNRVSTRRQVSEVPSVTPTVTANNLVVEPSAPTYDTNLDIDPPQVPPTYEECIKEWSQSIKNSNLNCNGAEIIVH